MAKPIIDKSKRKDADFNPGSFLKRTLWYFTNALFFINPLFPFTKPKPFILRLFGAKVGKRCLIKPRVNIKYPWYLNIGNGVSLGEGAWIDNVVMVNFEDESTLSQDTVILTGKHNVSSNSFDSQISEHPQTIGEGSWICAKSIVGPGVSVGKYSILSMGSVAAKDMKDFGIYQGNPAKFKVARRIRQ